MILSAVEAISTGRSSITHPRANRRDLAQRPHQTTNQTIINGLRSLNPFIDLDIECGREGVQVGRHKTIMDAF
jgi:hypothetical protein